MRNAIKPSIAMCWLMMAGLTCANPERLEFNRDIRPILSDKCFACHGFDANERKADLRLDTPEGAYALIDGIQAIKPGDPDASAVWRRIITTDKDEVMPPPESHKHLTDTEKNLVKRWIESGAEYQQHWAFVPPKKRSLPKISDPDWPRNPIDHFILARLDREGLPHAPEASPATLARRVTLDLTGLPPTPETLQIFLADEKTDSTKAYDKLVDSLLASRDYAERRAQDWLDLARYADTRGFADDKDRQIWPYRDWVINAIDGNMPFDQFTIEQLAGDMLTNPTTDQRIATGFHRNAPQAKGMTYPPEEYRIKGVKDRVNTTAKVWLGLTMECAECHDHKFDPISQKDYFSLYAFFNNVEHSGKGFGQGGPKMTYKPTDPASDPARAAITAERQRLTAAITASRENLPSPRSASQGDLVGHWDRPQIGQIEKADPRFDITGDLTITARIQTSQDVANILSKYDSHQGQRSYVFGIGGEGDAGATPGHLFFWLSSRPDSFAGVTVSSSQPVNDNKPHQVAVVFKAGESVKLFIDGKEDHDAKVIGKVPATIAVSARNLVIGAGYRKSDTPNAYQFKGALSQIHLYNRALGKELHLGEAGKKFSTLQAVLSQLNPKGSKPKPPEVTVPVMKELAKPRPTHLHLRGNFLTPGDQVTAAVPTILSQEGSKQPGNRLELARWLVDGNNSLVARVVVNRLWQSYFGHGLVRTADDFGTQGSPPTHLALLDWLAQEFVKSGWDMKHINRLIVASATYRQSARITTTSAEKDPNQRLLGQMPRVRLPAEQIRDQALAISGLLKPFSGGPAVFPIQPKDYWKERGLPGRWVNSKNDDLHRKSLYIYWRRMALHPTMELLDAPARATCTVKRNSANLPTQALVTLNDPIFVETASQLASRLITEVPKNPSARLDLAFQLCLSRLPDQQERKRLLSFIDTQLKRYADLPSPENAAWQSVASILLNLDETLNRP